ncbi:MULTISPECIES: hypothetical protein [Pseudomonas]|uniref:hypothetical protein n=1 Tax=Pseudomonas TaxID=286 RepID=UPI00273EB6C3|nr:hypothetical protein [Pseudomonas sp. DE0010]
MPNLRTNRLSPLSYPNKQAFDHTYIGLAAGVEQSGQFSLAQMEAGILTEDLCRLDILLLGSECNGVLEWLA